MAKSVVFQYRKPLISLRLCAFDEHSIHSGIDQEGHAKNPISKYELTTEEEL